MPLRPGIGGIKRTPTKLIQGVNGVKTEVTEMWESEGGVKKLVHQSVKVVPIGDFPVGSIVKLNEGGADEEYLIVNQGKPSSIYDNSCNGTWLLRNDIIEERVWDAGYVNKLEKSDIQYWLNNIMLKKYDSFIQSVIQQVKIPYRKNGGSGGSDQSGYNGLSCKIFNLSVYELGFEKTYQAFPKDGDVLQYFSGLENTDPKRIAELNGVATDYWTRSPDTISSSGAWSVTPRGGIDVWNVDISMGIRPALVLDPATLFSDNGVVIPG